MMHSDRIEILLPAYNGGPYLREQLDSILAQTDEGWHLTVSDDGSTDGSDGVLDGYAARFPEKITRVVSGRRFGCARDHFFWLTGQCDAGYFAYSDQDDVWKPEKLARLRGLMAQAEQALGEHTPILVFSDQEVTDGALNTIAPSLMRYQRMYFERFDYRSILMQNVVTGGAMMGNRALAQRAMACRAPGQTIMHDWWLAAVAARFGEIRYLDEPLGLYRQHGDNSVGAKDVSSFGYFLHKLATLPQLRRLLVDKKRQARVFLETYRAELTEEDLAFLAGMIRSRSGPLFYLRHRDQIHGFFRLVGMLVLG